MTLRDLLLGRERELAVLGRALAAAETGVPTLVLVEGDAGSGKSTLVDRFAEISSAHTLRRARGLEWESNTAFGVIDQLLERPVSNSDPVAVAHEIVDAAEQLTLIVVDDAHHSDVSSLQAITSALHRGRTAPLLFVLVAEETPFLREDVRQILDLHWSTRLHISPIDAPVIIDIARMRSGIDLSSGVALAFRTSPRATHSTSSRFSTSCHLPIGPSGTELCPSLAIVQYRSPPPSLRVRREHER